MMLETEAKMRLLEPDRLIERLNELDAALDRRLLETNTYFDNPDGGLKSTDQGLRIRLEVDQDTHKHTAVITHKGPRVQGKLKSRSETEVGVSDPAAAAEVLQVLGYQPVLTFEKRRTRYLLDGCRVEIDTLPHLGMYVEIEGTTEEDVLAVRDKIGMADVPLIRASYIAMLLTHLRESGSSASKMIRFENDPVGAA